MKLIKQINCGGIAICLGILYGVSGCNDQDHTDGKPGHSENSEDHKADHADHDDHDKIVAGPSGGRVLTSVEPHAEFFVTADRKVQIAFLNDDLEKIPAVEQSVKVVAGSRQNPTNLEFQKSGDVLISDKVLPAGNDFPVVVQIKTSPSADTIREKFNLNMSKCPTCENKEYACTCEHEDGE